MFSVKKSITVFGQYWKIKKAISFTIGNARELFGALPLFELLMLAVI